MVNISLQQWNSWNDQKQAEYYARNKTNMLVYDATTGDGNTGRRYSVKPRNMDYYNKFHAFELDPSEANQRALMAAAKTGSGGGNYPAGVDPTKVNSKGYVYNPKTGIFNIKPDAMIKYDPNSEDVSNYNMFGSTVPAPAVPTVGGTMMDSTLAQIGLAPLIYQTEAKYRPMYAQLDANIMKEMLTGKGGLLKWYQQQAGPGLSAAYEAANPRYATLMSQMMGERTAASPLLSELSGQAMGDLALGTGLSAADTRSAQQAARAAWAARGLGTGTAAAGAEVLATDALGRQRQQERRGFAATIAALLAEDRQQRLTSGVSMAGLAQNAGQQSSSLMGLAGGLGQTNKLIDPLSAFGSSVAGIGANMSTNLYGTNTGILMDLINNRSMANNANAIAEANMRAANSGGGILGTLLSTFAGGFGGGLGGALAGNLTSRGTSKPTYYGDTPNYAAGLA